ncbi:hypothetical protein P4571_08340 [Niallia alba]|uniref:hypothetical protein n=1 Tax=Niallia alba TaxID=2729105 RepID=UPI002E1E5D49|nr:hypothetical protein [Niallia alba]
MVKFETYITTSAKGYIDAYNVGCILQNEVERLLGDKDRFIENGIIKESDYRFNGTEDIREATEEEIKLYEALLLVERHFKNL